MRNRPVSLRQVVSRGVEEPLARCDTRFTKTGQEPNGIKLASARLVEQLLPQFLPGLDHEGEGLGSPFLDTRLHSMRSTGVYDQGF